MNKTFGILVLLIFFAIFFYAKAGNIDVAIYSDKGVWSQGIIALENFLEWKGLTHQRILSDDINNGILLDNFKVVIFPGGFAYDYKVDLNAKGEKNIKAFVNAGGGYLGICAGAFLATSTVIWEGRTYNYPIELFQGTATGAISEIKPWDGYTMTSITLNKNNSINKLQNGKFNVLYYGGPYFEATANQPIDTIATWDEYNNKLAIIGFKYGAGNVILSGPHPEVEENSLRDGSDFGSEFQDECSEWGWLWSAFDKLLNNEITDSTMKTSIEYSNYNNIDFTLHLDKNYEHLYSKNNQQFNIQIFSLEGVLVLESDFVGELNICSLSSGIYIYKLKNRDKIKIDKMMIFK